MLYGSIGLLLDVLNVLWTPGLRHVKKTEPLGKGMPCGDASSLIQSILVWITMVEIDRSYLSVRHTDSDWALCGSSLQVPISTLCCWAGPLGSRPRSCRVIDAAVVPTGYLDDLGYLTAQDGNGDPGSGICLSTYVFSSIADPLNSIMGLGIVDGRGWSI
ncbi:uncharacterized protein HMPREF1120_07938 [Exophiala dermatitidis NIH/UT8656]|uniref:Uncharacterized protein n=1 Tax=Exophiala dermatitidis (strain ATCC 34100 / CBS 525.76 / NIH/UT8656) TaxID=858893 RepID=H6C9V9_EXODN|nr:uncharacterized protein HMPREF1120_07938 [Exophiala dermatitidis NIH/UT8656]EHY59962.1 hypothetical protein HMPREF1120_07938 [Exophiala dermatitidis NIH/UT8656]